MRRWLHKIGASFLIAVGLVLGHGCGGTGAGQDADASGDATADAGPLSDAIVSADAGDDASPCFCIEAGSPMVCDGATGWRCAVASGCGAGSRSPTTLSGRVFDPSGSNPLYNVAVYVPNDTAALPVQGRGPTRCDTCGAVVPDAVALTATDANGAFVLTGVPSGKSVPVTVQTGRWRRTVFVDIPVACSVNTVPDGTLRLPRNQKEGTLPRIALLTGGGDDLGCFLVRLGIDPAEFTQPRGLGAVNVFQGVTARGGVVTGPGPAISIGTSGDCTGTSCPLWASKAALEAYDLVALSCEGDPNVASKPASAIQIMHDWIAEGGKVFAIHSESVWFASGPSDFQAVAQWAPFSDVLSAGTFDAVTSFPKGRAFRQWLQAAGGSDGGGMTLGGVGQSVGDVNMPAVGWITGDAAADAALMDAGTTSVKSLSFGVPPAVGARTLEGGSAPASGYCGKVAFSDVHPGTSPEGDVPGSCSTGALTPEGLALEFLFFDLSSCVFDDSQPPPHL